LWSGSQLASKIFLVDREGAKLYLEYLDKEMNIMGILSTFCVATVLRKNSRTLMQRRPRGSTRGEVR